MALKKIEKEIDKLTPDEQLRLVEKLVRELRKTKITDSKELNWDTLYGLGKGLWQEDAQVYVNRLRKERI